MDLYCTEEELILIGQAVKNLAENPSYQLHADEIRVVTCARMRGAMKNLLISVPPQGSHMTSPTSALDTQTPYIQKIIRRHEMEIRIALARGTKDFELELDRRRITRDFVSPDVVQCCLAELVKERCIHEMLGYGPDEVPVEQLAVQLNLEMINPDRKRGQYVGPVVGLNHRAALLKFANGRAIELLLEDLPPGCHIRIGAFVRMKFTQGKLVVSVAEFS